MISNVVVLGGGSAGLIAALTLKRRLPQLAVRVIRSPEIGIIGVGEGTTSGFPRHFFQYLGFHPRHFYAEAEPTWKLGIRFLWGKRPDFFYTFSGEYDQKYPDLPRNIGFYHDAETRWVGVTSACMAHDKAFPRRKDGLPDLQQSHAFHIENVKLVQWLEKACLALGVVIDEARMEKAERADQGIAALLLDTGERVTADLFVDASGFRSELLSGVLEEPYVSYGKSLFCDRAVIGGWSRTDEIIKPYTIAETMDAGWCWQIEHEHWINRGYVYSSAFISDDAALEEFLRKNPKVSNTPRVVKFRSGRYARSWVGNVVALGNAAGFVEPLEATALQVICVEARAVADSLFDSLQDPPPSVVRLYNELSNNSWDDIRDFLAVHYVFNDRLETPFWQACRADTDMGGADRVVEFYRENGPSSLGKAVLLRQTNSFGIEGYLSLLVGQMVPHRKQEILTPAAQKIWMDRTGALSRAALRGFTVKQTLETMRRPDWKW